jgi:hypothetical protein
MGAYHKGVVIIFRYSGYFVYRFLINVIQHTRILKNPEFTYFWVGMKRTSQNNGQSFTSSWADGNAVGYGLAEKFPDHINEYGWNPNDQLKFATYTYSLYIV